MSRCHSLSSTVCSGRRSPVPALLNEHVEPTGRVGDRVHRRVNASPSRTSTAYAVPPTSPRRVAASPSRSNTATVAPSAANRDRGRAPDSRRATGDDRYLPVELTHGRRRYGRASLPVRRESAPPRRGAYASACASVDGPVAVAARRDRFEQREHLVAAPQRDDDHAAVVGRHLAHRLAGAQRLVRGGRCRRARVGGPRARARPRPAPRPTARAAAAGCSRRGRRRRDLPRAARPRGRCRRAGRAARDRRRARPRTSTRRRRRA